MERKAIVITGLSVDKIKQLKKEYTLKYKQSISYDAIVSKLLLKANIEDIISE